MTEPYLTWQDDYAIGHPLIDNDHRQLLEIFNRLACAADNRVSEDVLGDIIFELVDYVESHFAREESLFMNAGYPDAATHINMHRRFENQIRHMADRFHDAPEKLEIPAVVSFLRDWLTDHIMHIDQDIVPYIEAERRGQPSDQNIDVADLQEGPIAMRQNAKA